VLPILGQEEKCDIRQAEQCAVNLQTQYDEGYMVYEAQDIHNTDYDIWYWQLYFGSKL
jgi:hypothetical protein